MKFTQSTINEYSMYIDKSHSADDITEMIPAWLLLVLLLLLLLSSLRLLLLTRCCRRPCRSTVSAIHPFIYLLLLLVFVLLDIWFDLLWLKTCDTKISIDPSAFTRVLEIYTCVSEWYVRANMCIIYFFRVDCAEFEPIKLYKLIKCLFLHIFWQRKYLKFWKHKLGLWRIKFCGL